MVPVLLQAALLLAACGAPTGEDSATSSGPTWYRDVGPLVTTSCVRCHADSGIARSFEDPTVAAALANDMAARVAAGTMPPPAPDPDCQPYEGSERFVLTAEQKQLFADWASAGAPLGDPATAPTPSVPVSLAPYDLELYPSASYTPDFTSDINDFRCFRLDLGNTSPLYLTGLEALIDNPKIVHHVVLFDVPDGAGEDEAEDPTAGFACGGFGESGWDFVVGWAPGAEPLVLPDGMGIKLKQDAHLVLQMHYYNTGPDAIGAEDRSGYGLRVAEEVEQRVYVYPLGTYDFTIPAGNPDYESTMILPWDASYPTIEILGVFPHMHQLGSGFDMFVAHPDSSQSCLISMDDWNFHNQVSALYDQPQIITANDALSLTCHWDNSAENPAQTAVPPVDVLWGEGTNEEMCFGFTYGTLVE